MDKILSKYGIVKLDKTFKELTTIRVGGKIKFYFEPFDIYNLTLAIKAINKAKINYKIIGNGSNLLCSDDDYEGVVIKLNNLNHFEINGNELYAEAGVPIIVAANFAINNGLSGLEFAVGIPAFIGGVIYMNASAYNEAISDVLKSVLIFDGKSLVWIDKQDLEFDYRYSTFQTRPDWTIVAINLELKPADVVSLKQKSIDRNQRRFSTQPISHPNCGSVFRNHHKMLAWEIIDKLNLRGHQIGGAQISNIHSNFICNIDKAKASDVNALINLIDERSQEDMGIQLHLEVERFNW